MIATNDELYKISFASEEYEDDVFEQEEYEDDVFEHEELDYIGVVYNCRKLNIRSEPVLSAPVICEIYSGTEVMIEDLSLRGDFYKVYTSAGITGYCRREFINIKH